MCAAIATSSHRMRLALRRCYGWWPLGTIGRSDGKRTWRSTRPCRSWSVAPHSVSWFSTFLTVDGGPKISNQGNPSSLLWSQQLFGVNSSSRNHRQHQAYFSKNFVSQTCSTYRRFGIAKCHVTWRPAAGVLCSLPRLLSGWHDSGSCHGASRLLGLSPGHAGLTRLLFAMDMDKHRFKDQPSLGAVLRSSEYAVDLMRNQQLLGSHLA